MKKCLVWIFFTLSLRVHSNAQTKGITDGSGSDQIISDSVFISKLAILHNKRSSEVFRLFDNFNKEADDLGFGYYSVDGFYRPTNGSNIKINYQFIFRHKKLISYQLSADLPIQQALIGRYRKFYSKVFDFSVDAGIGGRSNFVYYNYSEMTKPLNGAKQAKTSTMDKEVSFFMTPYSGTMYGGQIMGYGWGDLANRAHYNAIKAKITPEIDYILLYSLNPATRLSAIEYYYQHPELFNNKIALEARIKVLYKEMPVITTIIGTTTTNQNAEELVITYANAH